MNQALASAPAQNINNSEEDEMARKSAYSPPSSLLLLQTLLYFDWYYTFFLLSSAFVLDLYKLYALPYPTGYFSIEILILLIYLGLTLARLSYGMIGNRIESAKHIMLMVFLSVFSLMCNFYFIA